MTPSWIQVARCLLCASYVWHFAGANIPRKTFASFTLAWAWNISGLASTSASRFNLKFFRMGQEDEWTNKYEKTTFQLHGEGTNEEKTQNIQQQTEKFIAIQSYFDAPEQEQFVNWIFISIRRWSGWEAREQELGKVSHSINAVIKNTKHNRKNVVQV